MSVRPSQLRALFNSDLTARRTSQAAPVKDEPVWMRGAIPAWKDLFRENENHYILRLWTRLYCTYPRILYEPTEVVVSKIGREIGGRRSLSAAVEWLIARGYLVDFGRGENNVRRLQLVAERGDVG